MRRIQKIAYALGGFVLGVLFTSAVWLWAESRQDYISAASAEKSEREINAMTSEEKTTASEDNGGQREDPVSLPAADSWAAAAVYIGGDTVSFQGRRGNSLTAAMYGRIWEFWKGSRRSRRAWTIGLWMPPYRRTRN